MFSQTMASLFLLTLFPCVAQLAAQQPSTAPPTPDDVIHDLGVHKETAKMYVQLARDLKDLNAREHAWMLYSQARAQYNVFIDDIVSGIREGSKNQQKAMKHTHEVYQAGVDFENYVVAQRTAQPSQSQMGGKMITALLPPAEKLIGDLLGITMHPPSNDSKKQNLVDRVEGYKWPEWHTPDVDISPDTPPSVPSQTTKPQPPKSDHQTP